MKKFLKSACLLTALTGLMLSSFADRGLRRKSRSNHIVLNVESINTLKNQSGFKVNTVPYTAGNSVFNHSSTFKTFQKGNTTYILPSQKKTLTADLKPGYTGMKLVIKSN